jgi:hypothetical protein
MVRRGARRFYAARRSEARVRGPFAFVTLGCRMHTIIPSFICSPFATQEAQATRRNASDDLLRRSTEVEIEFVGMGSWDTFTLR